MSVPLIALLPLAVSAVELAVKTVRALRAAAQEKEQKDLDAQLEALEARLTETAAAVAAYEPKAV